MITQAELHERLHYCPNLGIFWWKPKPVTTNRTASWNARFAGQIAGSKNSENYAVIDIDGTPYKAHRLAWFYMTGSWPSETIDHRNRRTLDNAFENLREATHSQNAANRSPRKSKSGIRGVSRAASGRYRVKVGQQHIATFDTPEEARSVFEALSVKRFGEFAPR
ncbi:MAG: HNH endonuclease signature motif containing protein [Brevundimonas mediterranea]|uniref:HNH endonuclease signature motif containing protein n=1 Tax=Brevundimonas mediterranea TaxID=74329 RepID=UPI00403404C9